MSLIKLSIITINYNNLEGLQKTFDAATAQTYRDFEWIVIDGGSTDGSRVFIEEHQAAFAYWCSEPDKGIYNAMNKGVSHATGEYVLFMNSGDKFHDKQVLEKVLPFLKGADFIVGDSVSHHRDGSIGPWNAPRLLTAYMLLCYSLNHQAMFIRTQLLRDRPYREDLRIVADWEQQLYELVFRDATYAYLPVVVSDFYEDGISQNNVALHRQERTAVVNTYFSERLYAAVKGENELKELVNHIEQDSLIYKLTLFAVKVVRKFYGVFH